MNPKLLMCTNATSAHDPQMWLGNAGEVYERTPLVIGERDAIEF